jgi:hypothetical protein
MAYFFIVDRRGQEALQTGLYQELIHMPKEVEV